MPQKVRVERRLLVHTKITMRTLLIDARSHDSWG